MQRPQIPAYKRDLQLRLNEIRANMFMLQQEERDIANALHGFETCENEVAQALMVNDQLIATAAAQSNTAPVDVTPNPEGGNTNV